MDLIMKLKRLRGKNKPSNIIKYKFENKDTPWENNNHVPFFYMGRNCLIKPLYRDFADGSGSYFIGVEVYYYGQLVNTYLVGNCFNHHEKEEFIDGIASDIFSKLI